MEDAECMAVDLQAHELPKGWSDAGVQTGSTAGTRPQQSSSAERFARCYGKCEWIIFNSWKK